MKLSILNISHCPENNFELMKDDNVETDVSVAENEAVTTTPSLERGKVKYNK